VVRQKYGEMTYQSAARDEARRLFSHEEREPAPKDPVEVQALAMAKQKFDEGRQLDVEADDLALQVLSLRARASSLRHQARAYEQRAAATARRRRAAALIARKSRESESPIAPPSS
jgi:hypothetical protein